MKYRLRDAEQRVPSASTPYPQPELHILHTGCCYHNLWQEKQITSTRDVKVAISNQFLASVIFIPSQKIVMIVWKQY